MQDPCDRTGVVWKESLSAVDRVYKKMIAATHWMMGTGW